jgi:hypothetical protein
MACRNLAEHPRCAELVERTVLLRIEMTQLLIEWCNFITEVDPTYRIDRTFVYRLHEATKLVSSATLPVLTEGN